MSPDRRKINDSRLSLFGHGKERLIALVCECANVDCRRTVTMTAAEASDLRQQGKPILFRGHVAEEDAPLAGESSAQGIKAPVIRGSDAEGKRLIDARLGLWLTPATRQPILASS